MTLADGTRVLAECSQLNPVSNLFRRKRAPRIHQRRSPGSTFSQSKETPFIVQLSRGEIQVLGTHFDVADYEDENNINATLVQGSIKLTTEEEALLLTPGRQGRIDRHTGKLSSLNADTASVTAWTKGRLDIDGDLASLMRQISRWYDVDVQFQGKIPNIRIGGIIKRDINLSSVMEYLGENGLRYSIKEKPSSYPLNKFPNPKSNS